MLRILSVFLIFINGRMPTIPWPYLCMYVCIYLLTYLLIIRLFIQFET